MIGQRKKMDKTNPSLTDLKRKRWKRLRSKEFIYSTGAFALFFVIFVMLISVEQFSEKDTVEIGKPSPKTFLAPFDKDVVFEASYNEKRKIAIDSVPTVYKADSNAIIRLNQDMDAAFGKISQVETLGDPNLMIAALRMDVVFDKLDDSNLLTLFVGEDYDRVRRLSMETVLDVAGSPEKGAKTPDEVAIMNATIHEQINELQIPESYKVFLNSFVDLKITEPTLVIDEATTKKATDLAVSQVSPPGKSYRAGETIIRENDRITVDIYEALTAFNLIKNQSIAGPLAGIGLITFLGMILFLFYLYRFQKDLFLQRNNLILIGIMMVLILGLTRAMLSITISSTNFADLLIFLIPVAWLTMTLTILLNEYVALASGVLIIFYILLMIDPSSSTRTFLLAFISIMGSFGGIISVSVLKQRTDLARSGLYLAGINIVGILCLCLIMEFKWQSSVIYTIATAGSGMLSSVLMIGTLPWLERAFGITSSVRLLELSDPNNPLLKQMLIDAPGTYHHSIMVGNLAEAAAEQVGADPLLVRVGALYHDIGKLKRPYFFIENQISADNPHDKITPTLSALIIISHVKDGIELAEKHRLPENIKSILREHHGNSRANYFYIKALKENPNVDEEAFRYDGPKPMSKESAIVLLADNVEAVIRSHRGNTAGRLNALVYKIIQDKADEGILSESELTFKDLSIIATSFVRVLSGIFHSRVAYPEMPQTKSVDNRRKLFAQAQDTEEEGKQQQVKTKQQIINLQESPDPHESAPEELGENSWAEPNSQENQPEAPSAIGDKESGKGLPDQHKGLKEARSSEQGKRASINSDRRTYKRRKSYEQEEIPTNQKQMLEWHPKRLFYPDNAAGERLQEKPFVQVHKVKRKETHDAGQSLEYNTDEFAKTIYMTGSRFSLEDSRQSDVRLARPIQPKKAKRPNQINKTKRRLHKKQKDK